MFFAFQHRSVIEMRDDDAREEKLCFFIPPNLPPAILTSTQALLQPAVLPSAPATPPLVKWINSPSQEPTLDGPRLSLELPSSSGLVKHIAWHRKGDYFATVCQSFSPPVPFVTLISPHSQWRGAERGMDTPGITPTFPSSIQEDQGLCPARSVPPFQASFFCGGPCIWLPLPLSFPGS